MISCPFALNVNGTASPRLPLYVSELKIFTLGVNIEMNEEVIVVDIVERQFCVRTIEDAASELIWQIRFDDVLIRDGELTAKEFILDRVLVTCV